MPADTEPATAKADEVLSVEPAPGAMVTLDTRVTVYYATGMSKMPLVTNGLTEDEAVAAAEVARAAQLGRGAHGEQAQARPAGEW